MPHSTVLESGPLPDYAAEDGTLPDAPPPRLDESDEEEGNTHDDVVGTTGGANSGPKLDTELDDLFNEGYDEDDDEFSYSRAANEKDKRRPSAVAK